MKGVKFIYDSDESIVYHSFDEWGLYLSDRPDITNPSAKTMYIDIPGADGTLDLSDALTGDIKFNDRNLTFSFASTERRTAWYVLQSDISTKLLGRKLKIIVDDDPDYYYVGRISDIAQAPDSNSSTIFTMTCTVEPYKYELWSTIEDWEWDAFNFETGIIRQYKDIAVKPATPTLIEVYGARKQVIPKLTVTSQDNKGMVIAHEGSSDQHDLKPGDNYVLDFVVKEGLNRILVVSLSDYTATISIEFRGGHL